MRLLHLSVCLLLSSINSSSFKSKLDRSLGRNGMKRWLSSPSSATAGSGGEAKESPSKKKKDEGGPLKLAAVVSAAAAAAPSLEAPSSRVTSLDALPPFWREVLNGEADKPYYKRLSDFVESERKSQVIFPPKEQIFTAFNLCDFDNVKVVIIGQDPYHGPGQAHGLAFSVLQGIATPPSLRNIFQEAAADVKIAPPKHGNLACWSKQGVFLLNTALTVRKGEANSHQKKGWEEFTDAVVKCLSKKEGIVYLLWGKPAQTKCQGIDAKKNLVLSSSHPSPLGAYKTDAPFMGSRCFSKCNEYLAINGKAPIDWSVK